MTVLRCSTLFNNKNKYSLAAVHASEDSAGSVQNDTRREWGMVKCDGERSHDRAAKDVRVG